MVQTLTESRFGIPKLGILLNLKYENKLKSMSVENGRNIVAVIFGRTVGSWFFSGGRIRWAGRGLIAGIQGIGAQVRGGSLAQEPPPRAPGGFYLNGEKLNGKRTPPTFSSNHVSGHAA